MKDFIENELIDKIVGGMIFTPPNYDIEIRDDYTIHKVYHDGSQEEIVIE